MGTIGQVQLAEVIELEIPLCGLLQVYVKFSYSLQLSGSLGVLHYSADGNIQGLESPGWEDILLQPQTQSLLINYIVN